MGTIIFSGTAVLVVLGFGNHLYWLAAVAVLFLYMQYGRGSSPTSPRAGPARCRPTTARTVTAGTSRPSGSAATVASAPSSRAGEEREKAQKSK